MRVRAKLALLGLAGMLAMGVPAIARADEASAAKAR